MKTPVILLIDDNKIDLFIHSEIIRRMPFEKKVYQFSFAGDALHFLRSAGADQWPDVILLDIYMPVINGFVFLEKFAEFELSGHQKTRIVMVSSSLDGGDLKKAGQSVAVSGFLEKPLNMEKLYQLLKPVE